MPLQLNEMRRNASGRLDRTGRREVVGRNPSPNGGYQQGVIYTVDPKTGVKLDVKPQGVANEKGALIKERVAQEELAARTAQKQVPKKLTTIDGKDYITDEAVASAVGWQGTPGVIRQRQSVGQSSTKQGVQNTVLTEQRFEPDRNYSFAGYSTEYNAAEPKTLFGVKYGSEAKRVTQTYGGVSTTDASGAPAIGYGELTTTKTETRYPTFAQKIVRPFSPATGVAAVKLVEAGASKAKTEYKNTRQSINVKFSETPIGLALKAREDQAQQQYERAQKAYQTPGSQPANVFNVNVPGSGYVRQGAGFLGTRVAQAKIGAYEYPRKDITGFGGDVVLAYGGGKAIGFVGGKALNYAYWNPGVTTSALNKGAKALPYVVGGAAAYQAVVNPEEFGRTIVPSTAFGFGLSSGAKAAKYGVNIEENTLRLRRPSGQSEPVLMGDTIFVTAKQEGTVRANVFGRSQKLPVSQVSSAELRRTESGLFTGSTETTSGVSVGGRNYPVQESFRTTFEPKSTRTALVQTVDGKSGRAIINVDKKRVLFSGDEFGDNVYAVKGKTTELSFSNGRVFDVKERSVAKLQESFGFNSRGTTPGVGNINNPAVESVYGNTITLGSRSSRATKGYLAGLRDAERAGLIDAFVPQRVSRQRIPLSASRRGSLAVTELEFARPSVPSRSGLYSVNPDISTPVRLQLSNPFQGFGSVGFAGFARPSLRSSSVSSRPNVRSNSLTTAFTRQPFLASATSRSSVASFVDSGARSVSSSRLNSGSRSTVGFRAAVSSRTNVASQLKSGSSGLFGSSVAAPFVFEAPDLTGLPGSFGGLFGRKRGRVVSRGSRKDVFAPSFTAVVFGLKGGSRGRRSGGYGGFELRR